MADAPTTVSKLSGYFKERYASALENAQPKGLHLMHDIRFAQRDQQPGNEFHQPVLLTHEQGFTYASNGAGAFTLNDAEAGVTQDAKVVGTQMLLKSQIDYETAARASSSSRAFGRALDVVVENMSDSVDKRCELDCLYGQKGIGRVATANKTTRVITLQTTEFAAGIWAGQENAFLEFTDTTAATATLRATLVAQISAIDISAKTVTLNSTTITSTLCDLITDADFIWFNGQRTATAHNVYAGAHALLSATSGTVLNINVGNFSLWQATQTATAGALTFAKINNAMASAAGLGLDDDVILYVNPQVWASLVNTETATALRTNDSRYSPKFKVGANGIEFYSQTGTITIKSHRYCKIGFAYAISPKYWMRVGATPKTFNLPDRGDEFFRHVDSKAAYELRAYVNQALFTKALARGIIFTGITA